MDPTDNGAGGNVTMGASAGVGGLLSDIESTLARISSTLKDIDSSFSNIQKGMKGGAPAVGGGNTGSSTAAMETPGAGGGGVGDLAMGMAGGAMATGLMDKFISGAMNMYKDAIPDTATALTFAQQKYNYGIYNGNGRPLFDAPGAGDPTGFLPDLLAQNQSGSSSETGAAAMVLGLRKLGALSNDDVTARDTSSGFMDLYKFGGITNEQSVELATQSLSPESENMMLALGYQNPVNPDGSARTPFSIVNEVVDAATQGRGGFRNEQEQQRESRRGGGLYTSYEATGQPIEYLSSVMPFLQEAKTEYEKSGEPQGDWATLNESQRETITKDLTEIDNPEVNPQAREGMSTTAKALLDIGLTDDVIKGWDWANKQLVDYLGYLSNLPLLEAIATGSGANSVAGNTSGGLLGLSAIPFIGPLLGLTNTIGGTGESGSIEGIGTRNPLPDLSKSGAGGAAGMAVAGYALGDWNVSDDQVSKIHRGEMILPSRIATMVRHDLAGGGRPPQNTPSEVSSRAGEAPPGDFGGPGNSPAPQVTINVSVAQASDEEAVRLAQRVQSILTQETYLTAVAKGHGY